jgi:hypothetical protein
MGSQSGAWLCEGSYVSCRLSKVTISPCGPGMLHATIKPCFLLEILAIFTHEYHVKLQTHGILHVFILSLRLAHRSYLSGFRKRKSDRSKVAKKNIDKKLLKEKKYVQDI